jgi:hypothetical protein
MSFKQPLGLGIQVSHGMLHRIGPSIIIRKVPHLANGHDRTKRLTLFILAKRRRNRDSVGAESRTISDDGFGAAHFVVSEIDDFDVEAELLQNQPDFMTFLRELSNRKAVISLQDLRQELSV